LGELITKCQNDLNIKEDTVTPEMEMIKQFFVEYQRWYEIVSKLVTK